MGTTLDVRQERTAASLRDAVLRLAAERRIGTISVAELARVAGVHRSTVYEHADSVAGLLRRVLADELDAARAHLVDVAPEDAGTAVGDTTRLVLAHVERRADIYGGALGGDDDAELHAMLSGHFRDSVLLLLDTGTITAPAAADPELVARYIADGTVGAIDAWLRSAAPRDPERFLDAYRELLPPWWPIANGGARA